MHGILAKASVSTLPDVSIGHSLIQMVIALVVIVACIWGLSKVLAHLRSRAGTTGSKRRNADGGLAVIIRQTLGKDLSIATVRWGDREVLVGMSGSTITFLNDARAEDPPSPTVPAGFPAAFAAASPQPIQLPAAPAVPAPVPAAASAPALGPSAARTASLLETLRNATARH